MLNLESWQKGGVKVNSLNEKSLKDKLDMYSNGYVRGEIRSKEYEAKVKQEKRLNEKLDLADTMFNELTFQFTQPQKDHVKELIQLFPNFKELHSKASNEEIILSFIFYVKALETKENLIPTTTGQKTIRTLITDLDKQIAFNDTFEIINWKITLYYISHTAILPKEPKHIDHNLLYKGKQK